MLLKENGSLSLDTIETQIILGMKKPKQPT